MGTSRPALLIVTHIDWDHAWQRPQAIATALSRDFDVTVVSPVARRRTQLSRNPRAGMRVVRAWRLPGSLRSAAMYRFNNRIVAWQVARLVRANTFGRALVTAPECGAWTESLADLPTAYDCMDDALAFDQDDGVRKAKAADERRLLGRAVAVFCTSDELALRGIDRGAARDRMQVVPNGYDPVAFPIEPAQQAPLHGPLTLGFFGTIAEWLDFDLLERVLDANAELSIDMIGPVETRRPLAHPRMRVRAPMPNSELRAAVTGCDAMILPFRDTALTRAIDPVKMYEYLALGRPIVCPDMPSLARFSAFVRFYRDAGSLSALMADRASLQAASAPERQAFLGGCTWAARAEVIGQVLAARAPSA